MTYMYILKLYRVGFEIYLEWITEVSSPANVMRHFPRGKIQRQMLPAPN